MTTHSNAAHSGKILLGILIVCLFGDFLGVWDQPQRYLEPHLLAVQQPITKFWQKIAWTANRVNTIWEATAQLRAVSQQYSQAAMQLQELEGLRVENRELRRIIENTDRTLKKSFFTVPVVSFAQPTVMIGDSAGIQSGTVVISHGTLLGFLGETSQYNSRVDLLSQSRSKPIVIKTENGVQGLLRGDGRYIWMSEVPSDAKVAKGEKIFTVGQDKVPRDLLIGVVAQVSALPQDAVLKIQIKQLVSFFTTDVVEVY
jgi:cell shape-determining protein MreC